MFSRLARRLSTFTLLVSSACAAEPSRPRALRETPGQEQRPQRKQPLTPPLPLGIAIKLPFPRARESRYCFATASTRARPRLAIPLFCDSVPHRTEQSYGHSDGCVVRGESWIQAARSHQGTRRISHGSRADDFSEWLHRQPRGHAGQRGPRWPGRSRCRGQDHRAVGLRARQNSRISLRQRVAPTSGHWQVQ